MTQQLMFTVHSSLMRPEDFDPFGQDPVPAPARRERVPLVLAMAAILGLGMGGLATILLPRGPVAGAESPGRAATATHASAAPSAKAAKAASAAKGASAAKATSAGKAMVRSDVTAARVTAQ